MRFTGVLLGLLIAIACASCKDEKQTCVEGCEEAFTQRNDGCSSPTQPDKELCRGYAVEDRWNCRKGCGIDEAKPQSLERPAVSAAPAKRKRPESYTALKKVCDGQGVPSAADFDASKAKPNPALVHYKKLGGKAFVAETLATDYKDIGPADGANDRYASAFSVVVCVSAKSSTKVRECQFPKRMLELHDGTFEIRVLEAKTAKEIAAETVTLKNQLKSCPSVWNFFSDRDISMPGHSDKVLEVVKKATQ